MPNPLTLKLEQFVAFSDDERARLDDLLTYPAHVYARGEDIIREGDKVDQIHLVVSGLAARYKDTLSGGRQILAFLIPGDLCDVEVFVLEAMDHSIRAMTETRCVLIPAKQIKQMLTEVSSITQGLWWSTMTDSAVLRERIIDHGSRGARERIAHLFYEMLIRFRVVDGADDNSFPLAVTQDELADATGMTSVHVNRTMQQLRKDGLVELKGGRVTVRDPAGLRDVAQFNANYLHLTRSMSGVGKAAERVGDLLDWPCVGGSSRRTSKKILSTLNRG